MNPVTSEKRAGKSSDTRAEEREGKSIYYLGNKYSNKIYKNAFMVGKITKYV